MRTLIHAAMDRSRTTLLLLLFLLLGGAAAFMTIPKESNPDVTIPTIYVSVTLEGISPEDGERLLVRPLEQELRSLEGVKEMRSNAAEGYAAVILEFDAGFNPDKALQDVREKVDTARAELPSEADEPRVHAARARGTSPPTGCSPPPAPRARHPFGRCASNRVRGEMPSHRFQMGNGNMQIRNYNSQNSISSRLKYVD